MESTLDIAKDIEERLRDWCGGPRKGERITIIVEHNDNQSRIVMERADAE